MTRVFRIALAALVLMAVSAPRAAQETSSLTSAAMALRPTDHPRVPGDLSEFWMAPDKGRVRTAAQANLTFQNVSNGITNNSSGAPDVNITDANYFYDANTRNAGPPSTIARIGGA